MTCDEPEVQHQYLMGGGVAGFLRAQTKKHISAGLHFPECLDHSERLTGQLSFEAGT